MAFDGITIANIVKELNDTILNGRIAKIAQPENDELLLTIKPAKGQVRLVISASASLPLIYLSRDNKPSPMTAPNFCMLLRKHIANGRIVGISQPSLERIIRFEIEHLDELGDLCRKSLIVEIMGKHSNIIFCNEKGMIIDSIKHVSAQMSSVREVLPGREYFIPDTMKKENPLGIPEENFTQELRSKPMPAQLLLLPHVLRPTSSLPGLHKWNQSHTSHRNTPCVYKTAAKKVCTVHKIQTSPEDGNMLHFLFPDFENDHSSFDTPT